MGVPCAIPIAETAMRAAAAMTLAYGNIAPPFCTQQRRAAIRHRSRWRIYRWLDCDPVKQGRWRNSAGKARKYFFFEKKKQKTFTLLVNAPNAGDTSSKY